MAKLNKTKFALLGILNHMSGSGYDIKKFCDNSIGHFWNENYGHIYPVLQRLTDEGLIAKQVQQSDSKPTKNTYSITEQGKKELDNWLLMPVDKDPIRSELLLKIFLSKDIPTKSTIKKIEEVKKDSENTLNQYKSIEDLFNSGKIKIDKKTLILWSSTINYGKQSEIAKVKWCEDTLKQLEEIKDL